MAWDRRAKFMDIGASASSIFGSTSATDVLFVGVAESTSPAQETARVTIESQKREINRIRGYKLQLSLTEKQQLARIQVEIQEINQKVNDGTARQDELDDRKELFNDADRIIGKPIVDAEADEVLAELAGGLEELLKPKLNNALAQQVERLERLKLTLEAKVVESPDNRTAAQQFQSAVATLARLSPLRDVAQLSVAETQVYDDLVEQINERAEAKVELQSRDAIRVAELQSSIARLEALLPADLSQQPSSADVARAYVRLSS